MSSKIKHINLLSDEELMVLLKGHQSHAALNELHKRYSKKLLGFFYKMFSKDLDKAQDFVQDIFLKILEKNHLFDPTKNFYTWIFTVANNMCKTEFRNPFSARISDDEYEIKNKMNLGENLAEKDYFNVLLEKKSIDNLEEHHKITFVLRFMEHFSLQEIAEITQVSLGTVKSRLFYATQKMTTDLKEYNPKDETILFKLI